MGNKKTNFIEINGRRYDASTGQPVDGMPAAPAAKAQPVHAKAVAAAEPPAGPPQPIAVHHASEPQVAKPAHHHTAHRAAKAASRRKPEHSKTLRRQSVKKPSAGLKRHIKAHGSTDQLAVKPSAHIKPKQSAHHVDARKLDHAKQVPKSRLVKKFNRSQPTSIAVPVAVKKLSPPKSLQAHRSAHQPTPPPKPSKKPTDNLLERAVQHATSHEERPPKHISRKRGPSRRATSLAAIGVAFIVLGGLIGYSNLSNVRLKVASSRAGFTASLPGQAPAGYHLSHLNYSPGVVALDYHSNSDTRSFAITEKASAWDSSTLRDTFVASSGQDYQAIESGGRTLYLLGQNAATWVSGGVWYQVSTDGSLSNRQLVNLATSL